MLHQFSRYYLLTAILHVSCQPQVGPISAGTMVLPLPHATDSIRDILLVEHVGLEHLMEIGRAVGDGRTTSHATLS